METEALDRGDAQRRPGGIVSEGNMESLGLSCEDAQDRDEWRQRIRKETG